MSVVSTAANYGGRVQDNQQGTKQFYITAQNVIVWIYKRLSNGLVIITPSDQKKPVLINNDLIITGSIYNTSDIRLKENIKEITQEQIDNLFTINPIYYSYKNDDKKEKHFGVLAQDIEKVFPELVEDNYSGYKTVNYLELVPIMLAKMKNMEKEIDQLKSSNK